MKEYVHHLDSYLGFYSIYLLISALSMNAACWPAVYVGRQYTLAGIIWLQAVGVGRRNMSAGSIQYVSWQYTVCWLGWHKMMAGSTCWWAVQYMLAAVVGKVTVIKLLRYVTSYFFK